MAMDCGTLELHDASEGVRENFGGMGRMCYLKRRTPTTFACVCVCLFFFVCLFQMDGVWWWLNLFFFWNHHKSPSWFFLLNTLSGSFNVEPGSTSYLQRIERHDIADRHQNKWLFQTASLFSSICLYCTFSVSWFGYAVSHPKSTVVLLQVIADTLCLRAAFAAKADDHWSKSLHYLADEQYYAIAPYLGRTKWTWMDMHENGGIWIQAIIGLCKEQPLRYVGLSMSEAMASLRRSTAWSSAMQLVEGDGLKDLTTSRWCELCFWHLGKSLLKYT